VLQSRGDFRSLAEPNLLALPGQEASFLAGGEFPFPVLQGGNQAAGVTIVFKEFGIRLRFTPTITEGGSIRLHVAPEVSSLDFANGLVISGFQIPTILSRRAETHVELRDGQHLAIAPDRQPMLKNVTKIRSSSLRHRDVLFDRVPPRTGRSFSLSSRRGSSTPARRRPRPTGEPNTE
jgi:hypothetical protein